jgi:hypothetical protein
MKTYDDYLAESRLTHITVRESAETGNDIYKAHYVDGTALLISRRNALEICAEKGAIGWRINESVIDSNFVVIQQRMGIA